MRRAPRRRTTIGATLALAGLLAVVAWSGTPVALGGVGTATAADAVDVGLEAFCPGGDEAPLSPTTFTVPQVLTTALTLGVTARHRATFAGEASQSITVTWNPDTSRLTSTGTWQDRYVDGERDVHVVDVATGVRSDRYTTSHANASFADAVTALGGGTVWVRTDGATTDPDEALRTGLLPLLADLPSLPDEVGAGTATMTCSTDATAATVTYTVSYGTGDQGTAVITVGVDDTGAVLALTERYGTPTDADMYSATTTFSYGAGDVDAVGTSGGTRVARDRFRQALAVAAMRRMRDDTRSTAAAALRRTGSGRVAAVRSAAAFVTGYLEEDYLWTSDWFPEVTRTAVDRGVVVATTDPLDGDTLWFQVTVGAGGALTVSDGLS